MLFITTFQSNNNIIQLYIDKDIAPPTNEGQFTNCAEAKKTHFLKIKPTPFIPD